MADELTPEERLAKWRGEVNIAHRVRKCSWPPEFEDQYGNRYRLVVEPRTPRWASKLIDVLIVAAGYAAGYLLAAHWDRLWP